jgi:predicted glutamine amidotransferase
MCRMIAIVGSGSTDLRSIFAAFREGSKSDPYVKAGLGQEYTCHPHGWGLALYDGIDFHHVRSSLPVWEANPALPPMKGKATYAIFHSRLASNPALNSPICSHPFIAYTNKDVLLLAHNGGVAVEDPSAAQMVDTEWALSVIAKAGGLENALPELKERTRPDSALNLLLLTIPRDGRMTPAIHCLNYFKTAQPKRADYYRMYTGDFAGGKVVLSSTFKDFGISGLTNIEPAPFDQLFCLGGQEADSRNADGDAVPAGPPNFV